MKTCYIACALDCKIDFTLRSSDLVIGADRGYFTLVENGIKPNVAIGDFDSYTGKIDCEKTIVFPVKKDDTDSALAINYAVEQGYKKIVVFGAIGGELDHTIANIALAADFANKSIDISFVDGENVLFAIHNSSVCFDENAKGRISVFSFGDRAEGVYEKGLLYTLDNEALYNIRPLGVSNEFIGKKATVSVGNGTLLIYTSRENYENHLTRV
ncbi:MAG: thiamine diphosphokinase [Clostridia bacterium]|nr:thiamine diphosphokinase [Clostridia bacterium]